MEKTKMGGNDLKGVGSFSTYTVSLLFYLFVLPFFFISIVSSVAECIVHTQNPGKVLP